MSGEEKKENNFCDNLFELFSLNFGCKLKYLERQEYLHLFNN